MEIEKVKQKVRNKRDKGITKNQIKSPKAITLIALVITIIVLLILAGVSIVTLTGENGILTRAGDARTKTNEAEKEEREKLAQAEALLNIEDTEYTVEDGTVTIPAGMVPTKEEGENKIKDGLVAIDKNGNRWVWIEVPISVTEGSNTDSEIETALQTYATDYRSSWTDEWYDYYGTTYDGASEYSQVKGITNSTEFTIAQTYYGKIYTDNTGTTEATSYARGTTYYAKITDKINDTSGCGLTYSKYNELKSKMLNSIKNNGGFWIGQYEAGIEGTELPRTDKGEATQTPVCKEGAYPYNYVTCSQAQERASTLSTGNYTSSLMFGIQWDLVCKFIETNATNPGSTVDTIQKAIKNDSKDWGNYDDANFDITKGKYSENYADKYTAVSGTYTKGSQAVLLTTGATERNSLLNIYDFAGNVSEWTLEKSPLSYFACSDRGGDYNGTGSSGRASRRSNLAASISRGHIGFRPTLY